MSYRDLEVWQLARELTIEIHKLAVTRLPRHEMYEVGSQIRRSIKSVRSNIVEGYGRRRYKQEFLRFLTYAIASCDETRDHLDVLIETGSLEDDDLYVDLASRLETLGRKLHNLIAAVEAGHRSVRELVPEYDEESERAEDPACHPASSIQHPASEEPA
jgi:four helix bundle protein